jgi:hypothetical protein
MISMESLFEIAKSFCESLKIEETHDCHEDDDLFRKFQIDIIDSSPDGFH